MPSPASAFWRGDVMSDGALSHLKIVELGEFIAAPYCTKLMADLGAQVIKIEEPGLGDPSRSFGPFPKDQPHPEKSLLFAYMNTNKLGITLDIKHPLGRRVFLELLREADVLVESNPPKVMEELELAYNVLAEVNPNLIVTSITPFGQTGPYRDYKATELVTFQIGGIGYGTPSGVEDPDNHPPLKAPGHQAHIMAGISAAAATMCALFAREFSGRGQHIDISQQEPLVAAISGDIVSHIHRGETPSRLAGSARMVSTRRPLLAKDGYFSVQVFADNSWERMKAVLGNPDWSELEIFQDRLSRRDNLDALLPLIEEWAKDYTKEELYQILQVENHLPYGLVNTLEDVLNHPHFQERGTFVEMEHPHIGKFKAPGPAYRFSATPWRVASPAPAVGQHNEEIICGRLGYSKEDLARMRQVGTV